MRFAIGKVCMVAPINTQTARKTRKRPTPRAPAGMAASSRGNRVLAVMAVLCASPEQLAKVCAALKSDDLQRLHESAGRELVARKDATRPRLLRRIREMAFAEGFTVADLLLPYRSESALLKVGPVIYRHPERAELTWRGRGRRPKWLLRRVSSGRWMADLIR